jgi:hypothetical protein
MTVLSDESVEGRLIAHRQLLSLIVAGLGAPDEERIWAFLDERSVFQDAEEDPAALPTPAHGIQLALADELRLISEKARVLADRRDGAEDPPDATAAGAGRR